MIENQCFSKHKLLSLGQFLTKSFVFLSLSFAIDVDVVGKSRRDAA